MFWLILKNLRPRSHKKSKKPQKFPLKSGRTRKIPLNFDRSQISPKLTFSGKPLNFKKNLLNFERFFASPAASTKKMRASQRLKCGPPHFAQLGVKKFFFPKCALENPLLPGETKIFPLKSNRTLNFNR